ATIRGHFGESLERPGKRISRAAYGTTTMGTRATAPAPSTALSRTRTPSSPTAGRRSARLDEVSADNDPNALELFDVGVAGGRQRLAQCTYQVHGAVGDRGWAQQNVLQIADRSEIRPL